MHTRIQIYWCRSSIFRHLKLELLTQFPASNDEKYINVVYIWRKFVSFYGYVHWRMTTEISVMYGSEKVKPPLCTYRLDWASRSSNPWRQTHTQGRADIVVDAAAFYAGAHVMRSSPALVFRFQRIFLPRPPLRMQYCGEHPWPRDSAFGLNCPQGANFESCVWRVVSSDSSHHPQEARQAKFSLHVHKPA